MDLCSALWGDLRAGGLSADLSEDGITSDLCPEDSLELDREQENSLETLMERKEALSTWLREQAAADTEAEVAAAGGDSARAAFSWLVGGRLTEAREAAQRGGEHRLAILLAQARGSDCVRRLLIRQMEEWREVSQRRYSTSHIGIELELYHCNSFSGRHGQSHIVVAPSHLRVARRSHDLDSVLSGRLCDRFES